MSADPRRCVCPGSYDPFTVGHLDIVTRAAALFDEVVVAVLYNPAKSGTFDPAERVALIESATSDLPGVRSVAVADRLVVDVCRDLAAGVLVKGIRSGQDYAYELPMATMNREMTGVETVFLPGNPAFAHYSSSLIRQIAGYGADVSAMVPAAVLGPLLDRVRTAGR